MSKIICDMCGTSYPETSNQCPICGCVRPADIQAVIPGEAEVETAPAYNHVKGGRFSKSNVKRRNKGTPQTERSNHEPDDEAPKNNAPVIVLIVMIFLAVVAVAAFIILKISQDSYSDSDSSASVSTEATEVLCEGLEISGRTDITITADAYKLDVVTQPANTTEQIIYESSDPAIATVDEKGVVTPVGTGTAVITITCGEFSAQVSVTCEKAPEETTEATEETTEPTVPETTEQVIVEELRLNRMDISMSFRGETWKLYNGNIPVKDITWTTDNDKVATIKDGVVTAVGKGTTNVHAEYADQKVSCIIRCNFEESSGGMEGTGGVGEDGGGQTAQSYSIYSWGNKVTDITIRTTDSAYFEDAEGNLADCTWESSDTSVFTVSGSGGKCTLTPVANGTAKLIATYKGVTYTCIVRVVIS